MSSNISITTSLKPTSSTIPSTAPLSKSSLSTMVKNVGSIIFGFVCAHPVGVGATIGTGAIIGLGAATIHACRTVPPPSETTVEKCKAKLVDGSEINSPIGILSQLSARDKDTAFVINRLRKYIPLKMDEKFAHAILSGAHVVLQGVKLKQIIPNGQKSEKMKPYSRTSSHYDGKMQFGIDVLLFEDPETYGHLLVGKTKNGDVFFQMEKHGTGLSNFLLHMYDFVQHKWGGNVQVGPLGYVQSSEKNDSELVVRIDSNPHTKKSSLVIEQRTPQ